MSNIWLYHFSIIDWTREKVWIEFLSEAQEILAAKITHLDSVDPVKRKVENHSIEELAQYITSFGISDTSRHIFGKIKAVNIRFSISIYRTGETGFSNSFIWYIPSAYLRQKNKIDRLKKLFSCGNQRLKSFYALGDRITIIAMKKKPSGTVNLQRELLGIFWLTYFNKKYVHFLGQDKFVSIVNSKFDTEVNSEFDTDGGLTLMIGTDLDNTSPETLLQIEKQIGTEHFVDPNSLEEKAIGEFALPFKSL